MLNMCCSVCGKSFVRYEKEHLRNLSEGRVNVYCSRKCASTRGGRKYVPTNRTCPTCGKSFVIPCGRPTQKCCSSECAKKLSRDREKLKWMGHVPKKRIRRNVSVPKNWIKGQCFDESAEMIRREKIRVSIQKRYESGWMPKAGRCRKIKYTSTICGDVLLDGKWELDVAKWLDANNIQWKRNVIRFPYFDGDKLRHYTPDFYIADSDRYLEVKGYETELDRTKWKQFPNQLIVFKKAEVTAIRKCESTECRDRLLSGSVT